MNFTSAEIIRQFESAGFRAAFLSYSNIGQIKKHYDELAGNHPDIRHVQNSVNHFFKYQPPDIPFEPLSFLVIAYPCDAAEVVFTLGARRAAVPVPQVDSAARRAQLDELQASALAGWRTAHTRGISQKLLAAFSGLGRYGRNNICYAEGIGSYFLLRAFYTDIPCENSFHSPRFLDECGACDLCRQSCPTGAIGESPAIDADRCLTRYSENDIPAPDWLPGSAHHAMFGCLRCQEICPVNRALPEKPALKLELDEAETGVMLSPDPVVLPPELRQKFIDFGFDDYFLKVAARNAKLALQNILK